MKLKNLITELQKIQKKYPQSKDYDIQVFGEMDAPGLMGLMGLMDDFFAIKSPWADVDIDIDIDTADKIIIIRINDKFEID